MSGISLVKKKKDNVIFATLANLGVGVFVFWEASVTGHWWLAPIGIVNLLLAVGLVIRNLDLLCGNRKEETADEDK